MTLYANTFSISTMFSMIFSRTRKSEHLRSFAEKEKNLETITISRFFMELLGRFELPTSSLPRMRSTY